MKVICLDFDDFSVLNNHMDLLLRLKESYPKLKVSLFTIPFDATYESNATIRIMRKDMLRLIKKNLNWIELIPHGLTHMQDEFKHCTYKLMKNKVLPAIDDCFKKDGLPYVKGFKAPFWEWNKNVVKVLDDEGWWGAVNRQGRDPLTPKKFYVYSHSIGEPFWESTYDTWKLHGHISGGIDNAIDSCFPLLFKMPADAEFRFASELVETL